MSHRFYRDNYGTYKDLYCHIIEGPISWIVLLMISMMVSIFYIIENIEEFIYKKRS
jgi:TM2 domain-containing membrane protein YozV